MGPIVLFDKSFLQSLSEDEALWFDHFFLANVCPIFYVETQADLVKEDSKKFTPEQLVEQIARKFPEISGAPNAYHPRIIATNLTGEPVPMLGQVILPSTTRGVVDGHVVIAYPETPEGKAFLRWTQREFHEEEREVGRLWRSSSFGTDPAVVIDHLRKIGVYENPRCATLNHVLTEVNNVVGRLTPEQQLAIAIQLLGIPEKPGREIIERFRTAGEPGLESFAGYAAFALKVELFYHIAVHKGRMSVKQRMDINYLFYLPFCSIFVSTDWVHAASAPLFLRDDQEFVSGPQLKAALKQLNETYSAMPDAANKSIVELAPQPPKDGNNLVTRLWDRHWHKWKEPKTEDVATSEEIAWVREHSSEIDQILHGKNDSSAPSQEYRALVHTKTVRTRRGRWFTVPEAYRTKRPTKNK